MGPEGLMRAKKDEVTYMHFIVFDSDGTTPLSGEAANCTSSLRKNGAAASETVTIAEIGSTGRYVASFTPLAVGSYHLSVTCPDDRVQGESFEVEAADLDSLDTKLTFVHDIAGGRRKIDRSTKKETFYKSDNTTDVATFSLFDRNGDAATEGVYERTRD